MNFFIKDSNGNDLRIFATTIESTEKDYDAEKTSSSATTTSTEAITELTTLGTTTEEIDGTPMYPGITEQDFSTENYYEDIKDDDATLASTTTDITKTSKTTTTTASTTTTPTTTTLTTTVMMETSSYLVTTVSSIVTEKLGDWIWTQWSECSKTCGHGLQRRVKHCSKGKPSFVLI